MTRLWRLGTRASALALRQAAVIRDQLAAAGDAVELVEITTTGDERPSEAFHEIGETALFTRQLDEALLAGRIDLAVHSAKDLPSRLPAGVALAAIGRREDPRDALVARPGLTLATLPFGAIVATCSVRRRAQLLAHRPDLALADLRGNVGTRLARFDREPAWAAIVLASAGLSRLGLAGRISERVDPAVLMPAPGQGAIAVTIRAGEEALGQRIAGAVEHRESALAVIAERSVLAELDGGCQVPIGALGIVGPAGVALRARVVSADGARTLEAKGTAAATPAAAARLGREVAAALVSRGAPELLAASRGAAGKPVREVTR